MKVLVAEDERINQRLIARIFKKMNIYVEIVSNGKLALEILENTEFDVFFLDINMPVKDGIETIKELRENDKIKDMKVVALSGYDRSQFEEVLKPLGFDDFLNKPINNEELKSILSNL